MPTSPDSVKPAALATTVSVTDDELVVRLSDGRTLSVPISWFPRLAEGTSAERNRWRLIARGEGIHWPDLDEDIAVEHLLEGRRSGEGKASLDRWRAQRRIKASERPSNP